MMGDCNLIPQTKALEVHHRLVRVYGEPRPQPRDPIATLVSTILSQNTNDALRDRAFRQLRERFPTWEEVRDAPVHEIAQAIQVAGLGGQKAQRIKASLARISQERGELRLDFLRQMPVGEARRWLLSFNGIGPKTAAILLLFALDVPAFPVDTHIHRVSKRLGLIPPTASREKAHEILEALMPPETYYTFHINVIRHGREVCGARRPRCELCVLRDLCTWYATQGAASRPEEAAFGTGAPMKPDDPALRRSTHVVLVRHAESVGNKQKIWQGATDGELTPLGFLQAERAAERLAAWNPPITRLYSSPLRRALQTAQAIACHLGLQIFTHPDLREIDLGQVNGLSMEEFAQAFPEHYARWQDRFDLGYTWPGGEQRQAFFERVAAAAREIVARHPGETLVWVSHGGTIRAALAGLVAGTGPSWWKYELDNASISHVRVGEDGHSEVLSLNDVEHLASLSEEEDRDKDRK